MLRIVDAMNVIGSRPDGWWRDRHGAMVRLVESLERWAQGRDERVVVVLERPPAPPITSSVVEVAAAPRPHRNSADDEIVRRVRAAAGSIGHGSGAGSVVHEILVVTSDRELAARVRAAGAEVEAAAAFRRQIEAETGGGQIKAETDGRQIEAETGGQVDIREGSASNETKQRQPTLRIGDPAKPVQGATSMAADDQQSATPPATSSGQAEQPSPATEEPGSAAEQPSSATKEPGSTAEQPSSTADISSTPSTSRVQQAAANIQQAIGGSARAAAGATRTTGPSEAELVARRYFEKINAHDLDAAVALWAVGGREHVRGQVDATAPEGVRSFIGDLLAAMPDLHFEILGTTSEGERCGVQWRLTGTFVGPGSLNGVAPTGHPLRLEGLDLLTVRDGLVQQNDAFTDTMEAPRQIGLMPPRGSAAEQGMTQAFNVKTRVISRAMPEARLVAEGVWVVQGQPGRCNVYLIEDDGGVTLFDAGARTMVRALASAGAKLGGIRRVVLGHGHTDHRGAAPGLGVPVLCHPDAVKDAEGSGGFDYWPAGLATLPTPQRQIHRVMHRFAWDGGPVAIAGTVREGDEVAGFRVVDIPGHAPGQIALWRESDRLALATDCFYTLDMWGRDAPPKLPEATYNFDTEQARASLRKLAALEPAAAWPGHAKPVTGDVRGQLERAADTT